MILYKIREAFNGDGIGKRIQWQIKGRGYFKLVCLAGSVWSDTKSQYRGIDDTPTTTTTTKTYQINNQMILYTRGDMRHLTGGIELETASKTDSTALPILVGLAGKCDRILNIHILWDSWYQLYEAVSN